MEPIKCTKCGEQRALIDGICDNCTIKIHGSLKIIKPDLSKESIDRHFEKSSKRQREYYNKRLYSQAL